MKKSWRYLAEKEEEEKKTWKRKCNMFVKREKVFLSRRLVSGSLIQVEQSLLYSTVLNRFLINGKVRP